MNKIFSKMFLLVSMLMILILGLISCTGEETTPEEGGKEQVEHVHTFGEWITEKEPTCSETGSRKRSCTGCDAVETETLEKTAHAFDTRVVAPTTDAEGYTVYTCRVCGYTYNDNYVSLGGVERLSFTLLTKEGQEIYAVTGISAGEGSSSTRVNVPAKHRGKPVVAISGTGFQNSDVTYVTLPETITQIDAKAFYGCASLKEFTVPSAITALPDYMFYNCSSLTSVTLGANVTSLGKYAFYGCEQLKSLTLPSGLASIEEYTFSGCKNLNFEKAALPAGITKIGAYAFSGCMTLEGRTQSCLSEAATVGKTTTCDCDPISLMFKDETGASLTSAGTPVSEETAHAFDTVGELFLAALGGVKGNSGANVFSLSPTDGAYNGYNTFFRAVKQFFNDSSDEVSHLTEYKITDGAVIGVNTPLLLTAKTGDKKKEDGKNIESYLAAFTKLWSDEKDTVLGYAATIAEKYTQNAASASTNTLEDRLKYAGAVYTDGGLFMIPMAAELTDGSVVLICFFIDDQGDMYVWVSDMAGILALDRTQDDFSVRIYGRCVLFGIPQLILPKQLKTIETSAFNSCGSLRVVTFPQGLETIGESAFSACENLEDVTLPSTISTLGKGAFRNCSGLKSATVGALTDYLFYGCVSLEEITVSSDVEEVGLSALDDCRKIREIVLPATVTKISDAAFYNCISLLSVGELPALTQIGSTAFYGCASLSEIDLPETLTSIGGWAFEKCSSLETVVIPSKVQKIDWGVFRDCVGLKSITLPEAGENTTGITEIENAAFENCSSLESIAIPTALTRIAPAVFSGCVSLASIDIPENVLSLGEGAFAGCTSLTDVTVGGNVEELESSVFAGCTGLTSVVISDSVVKMGPAVFSGCNSLTSLTVPFIGNRAGVSVTDKNQYPFGYIFGTESYDKGVKTTQQYYGVTFSSLTSDTYYIPSTLKNVVVTGGNVLYGAFTYCVDLVGIDIGALETTSLEGNAFSHCEKLSSFTVPAGITNLGDAVFYGCESLALLEIADTVTSIGKDVFYNCPIEAATVPTITLASMPKTRLRSLTINGGTTIVDNAFAGAGALEELVVADSVTFVGQNAFSGCESLLFNVDEKGFTYLGNADNPYIILMKAVSTGESVCVVKEETKFIYDEAFVGRSELSEIDFPQGLLSVGSNTFRNISAAIIWHSSSIIDRIAPYAFAEYRGGEISVPDTVTEIGAHAFENTSASLLWGAQNAITAIGESAFERYQGTSLSIPQTVETIGAKAFAYCTQLVRLTIPDSVVAVGENAFLDCRLEEVVMPTTAIDLIPKRMLKKVTLTQGDYIGAGSFSDATSLTELVICDSVSFIGANAFTNCPIFSISMPTVAIPSVSKKHLKTVVITSGTAIEKDAFAGAVDLVSITLPSTLETIGSNAFLNCQKLVEICNHSSVIVLEKGSEKDGGVAYYAKNVCTDEQNRRVKVEDDFIMYEEQGEKVLMGYGGLATEIVVPSGTTKIFEYAFRNCADLVSVVLPDTVTEVGDSAFYGCSSIVTMTVPFVSTAVSSYSPFGQIFGSQEYAGGKRTIQRYSDIGGGAHESVFYIPFSLQEVTVLGGEVRYGVFSGCEMLKRISLPDSATALGDYALYNCSGLEGILSVPANAESIGKGAFTNCVLMTGVRIYDKVESVGENAFGNCTGLQAVYNDGTVRSWCNIDFANSIANPLGFARKMVMEGSIVDNMVVPTGVTAIKQYQFLNGTFSTVVIPDTVAEIGVSAFDGCSNLNGIAIPNAVSSADKIGQDAFKGCPIEEASLPTYAMKFMPKSRLRTVTLTTGTVIAENALSGCLNLESVDFRSDITTIQANAFYGCSKLTSLTLPDSVETVDENAFTGCRITIATIPTIAMLAIPREYLVEITLTTGTIIEENALSGCQNLESIVFRSKITTIESKAFSGCVKLRSIELPDTVTSIDEDAFENCSFNTITVPVCVIGSIPKSAIQVLTIVAARDDMGLNKEPIPENAFKQITALRTVYIGRGITGIGNGAFSGCSNLQTFSVTDNTDLISIGEQAFWGCVKMTDVSLGEYVETIGSGAFFNCGSAVSMNAVTIPATIETIGDEAFSGCAAVINWAEGCGMTTITSLSFSQYAGTQFTIPSSITTIEGSAFLNCTSLTGISVPDTVTSIGLGAFKGCRALTGIVLPFIGSSATATGQASLFGYIFGTETFAGSTETVQQYLVEQQETNVTYYIPSALRTVSLQGNVTELNYGAFSSCAQLTAIILPTGLTNIRQYAFKDCRAGIDWNGNTTFDTVKGYTFAEYKGASLDIPASVASLEEKAFYNCEAQLLWSEGIELTSIGGYVFENYLCETLSLPQSVTAVAGYAFYGCVSEIDWGNANVTKFVTDLFNGYAGTTITVPDKVTTIESYVFNACVATIKWESPIETFSEGLFAGYGNETCEITIPNTVTEIGSYTFAGCRAKVVWGDNPRALVIRTGAFERFQSTEFLIPSSVTTLEKDAFLDSSLLKLTIQGNDELQVHDDAFSGCNLKEASIPTLAIHALPRDYLEIVYVTGGTEIPDEGFYGSPRLKKAYILEGVTSIGVKAFYQCINLEKLIVPETIEHVGKDAFADCDSLVKNEHEGALFLGNLDDTVYYGSQSNRFLVLLSVDSQICSDYNGTLYHGEEETRIIYQNAYVSCDDLIGIDIPDSIVEIGENAFKDLGSLNSLQFGSFEPQLKYIRESAFSGCASLVNLNLPACLVAIASEAFRGCGSLTSLVVPASVTDIGEECFLDCSLLETLSFASGSNILSIAERAFAGCVNLTDVVIPNGLEEMGEGVFSGCGAMETLSIPFVGSSCEPQGAAAETLFGYIFGSVSYSGSASVTQYYSATGSVSYYIPTGLETVSVTGGNLLYGAFYNCDLLRGINLTSIETIGDKAFYNCGGINTVLTIPETITEIGNDAFVNCDGAGVEIIDLTSWCAIDFKNGNANPLSAIHTLVSGGETVTELIIPDDVETVRQYAFYGCTSIQKVTIPVEVTTIGMQVFNGCTSLSTSGVYYIGALTDWCAIGFGDEKANPLFYGHSLYVDTDTCVVGEGVTSLTIDAATIGEYAFFGATYLTEVIVENATEIGAGAFGSCINLLEITLPFIGRDSDASAAAEDTLFGYIFGEVDYVGDADVTQMYGATGSATYHIPASLRTVNVTGGDVFYGAFYGCRMLTSVTLPEGLTAISEKAFYDVDLTAGLYLPSTIEEIGAYAFEDCTVTKLYYASAIDDWCAITFGNASANPLNVGEGDVYLSETEQKSLSITAASIGNYAFYNWTGLEALTLSVSTTFTSDTVFYGLQVSALTASDPQIALIPRSSVSALTVTGSAAIRSSLMSGMTSLQTVVVQDTVPSVGSSAFYGCTGLINITLGSGVTSIGSSAFNGCSNVSINDIAMPQGLTSVGGYAFSGCQANIVWADNAAIQVLGTNSFSGYLGDNFTIPTNVETIGANAFENCTNLRSSLLTFNSVLVEIGNNAFKGCDSEYFTSLTVPDCVDMIGAGAFNACKYLTSVTLPFIGGSSDAMAAAESTLFGYVFGTSPYDGGSGTDQTYAANVSTQTYYLPDGLEEVTITGGGNVYFGAFYNCSAIVTLTLDASVEEIGAYAFFNCGALTAFDIPESVASIGSNAFEYCGEIAEVTYLGDINDWCKITFADNGANPLTKNSVDHLTLGTPLTAEVTIASDVTVIPASTFKNATVMESITLPAGITAIGDDAFRGCDLLATIIHNGTISDWCAISFGESLSNPLLLDDFDVDHKLLDEGNAISGSVVIEEGVSVIPYATFMYTAITAIELPSTLTTVSQLAFTDCNSLLSVDFEGTVSQWCAIYFDKDVMTDDDPNPLTKGSVSRLLIGGNNVSGNIAITGNVTSIPACTFKNASIGNLTLASTIISFGLDAFKSCSISGKVVYPDHTVDDWCGLQFANDAANPMGANNVTYLSLNANGSKISGEVTIGSTVETIPAGTFKNSEVTVVNISDTVTTIKNNAFLSCTSLEGVNYVGDLVGWCDLLFENVSANPLFNAHDLYFSGVQVTTVTLPSTDFDAIKSSTFAGWSGTSITIPSNVTSIGQYAFDGCEARVFWTSPAIEAIEEYAFYGYAGASFTIPETVTEIAAQAFACSNAIEEIVIPNSVTTIGNSAFANCENLSTINVPASVIGIGTAAFGNCPIETATITTLLIGAITDKTHLTTLTLKNGSNVPVGDEAFKNCSNLTTVIIEDEIQEYGYDVFAGCPIGTATIPTAAIDALPRTYLVTLTIASGDTIVENAFKDCTTLTTLTVADTVTTVGANAFSGCPIVEATIPTVVIAAMTTQTSLETLTLTSGTTIVENAFKDCTTLTTLTVADSVTSVGANAFSGCPIVEATIPTVVIAAMTTQTSLETLTLTSGTTIVENAFKDCTTLTTLTIANTVTTIEDYAFSGCTGVTAFAIPRLVTSIGQYAFQNCTAGVTWNSPTITSIGNNAFRDYKGNMSLPSSLTSIGNYAFYNCTNLTSLVIPSGVTTIGNSAFYNYKRTAVTLPGSVTTISSSAFSNCSNLTRVNYTGTLAAWCGITFTDDTANPLYYAHNLYIGSVLQTSITIPGTVSSIKSYAFYNWNGTSVTIPSNVTAINSYAFQNCTGLTTVSIPTSVTAMGTGIFNGCTSLQNLTIPYVGGNYAKTSSSNDQYPFGYIFGTSSYTGGIAVSQTYHDTSSTTTTKTYYIPSALRSVTVTGTSSSKYIPYGAFDGCSMLTSVSIGSSVSGVSIGDDAFRGCTGLSDVTIPSNVTSIGSGAFSGCSSLISMTIPFVGSSKTASSASSSTLFGYIFGQTSYNGGIQISQRYAAIGSTPSYYIPEKLNSVTITGGSLLYGAFYNCTMLTDVIIKSGVSSTIGNYAFYSCSNLMYVELPNNNWSIGTSAFQNCYRLAQVNNKSTSRTITIGSTENGYVGYYAKDVTSDEPRIKYKNGYYYYYDGSALSVINYVGTDTTLTLPSSVDNVAVTEINQYAFYGFTGTSITIPSGVTSIGKNAFYTSGGNNLTSISIPDSITTIAGDAFNSCNSLNKYENEKGYYLGNSTNHYVVFMSAKDTSISSITLDSATKAIYDSAFSTCSSLATINIPNTVTSVGNNVFSGCPITKAEIPTVAISALPKTSLVELKINGGTSIAASAFSAASNLTTVTIANTVTSIGSGAFSGCSIETATMPTTAISSIPQSKLRTVVLNGGTSIADNAFQNCSTLLSITIPSSVTSIGNSAFNGCYYLAEVCNLSSLSISAGNNDNGYIGYYAKDVYTSTSYSTKLTVTSDGYIRHDNGSEFTLIGYLGTGTSLTIPNNITAINKFAFVPCSGLTSITIPDGVTSIGERAFMNSSAAITWDGTPTIDTIGQYVFYGYAGTSLTIPNSVTTIESDAFNSTNNCLASIILGSGVMTIEAYAFDGCAASITWNSSIQTIGQNAFTGYSGASLTIPNSVTTISTKAFENTNSDLTSITLGSGVTSIGTYAFQGCSASITWNSSITSIGQYAFYGYTGSSITIPSTVTSISANAFESASITGITFAEGSQLSSIGNNAFKSCSSLTSIAIPSGVTSIGQYAFQSCSASITWVSPTITSIGQYAFSGYAGTSFTIPSSVTTIGDNAFNGSSITSITIPANVTQIGKNAFSSCSNLSSVTFETTSGWYRTSNASSTTGTNLTVTNASTNANNLKNTYKNYYWKKRNN